MPSTPRRKQRRRPRRLLLGLLVVGLILVAGLALSAWTLRHVPDNANAARTSLEAAIASVSAGDADAAEAEVAQARVHVDELQGAVQGFNGRLWSAVPVAGGTVRDVRHLADALDDLTVLAQRGVTLAGTVTDPDEGLLRGQRVDLDVLRSLTDELPGAKALLDSAVVDLDQVADSRPFVGTLLADARDEALDRARPLASALTTATPVAEALPDILGASGRRRYLVAMLNPSEQRYSGGAPLTMATMTTRNGRIHVGEALDSNTAGLFERLEWPGVPGNVFRRPGPQYITGANYAPSWSVSGPEVAGAWHAMRGQKVDGVIAIDVVALGDLLTITGPVSTEGYGVLDGAAFVHEVIGNYDAYEGATLEETYELTTQRHELNRALVPLFTERFFNSEALQEKVTALNTAAAGRHFALWLDDPAPQAALADAGFSGDLSEGDHDYIGVFNQNTNASKADYWQRRAIRSRVVVAEDGSAEVRLTIDVDNDSPPWPHAHPDPGGNSFVTRHSGMSLAAFLPRGAELLSAQVDGKKLPRAREGMFFDRPYTRVNLDFTPGQRRTYSLSYRVPQAAVPDGDGVRYLLDIDPQSLVIPEEVHVDVKFPDGWTLGDLPEGWTRAGERAVWKTSALTGKQSFGLTAEPQA